MFIKITYICDGAIYCGFKPDGVEVLEERQVLYPEQNCVLERISDKEHFYNVWLKNGDVQENYIDKQIDGDYTE